MSKRIVLLVCFLAIALLGILTMTGCNSSDSDFKSVTVENELCHYSLEYPSDYDKEIWDNFDFDVPYTELILNAPTIREVTEVFAPSSGEITTVVGHTSPGVIYVFVSDSKQYWGEWYSATDELEERLEDAAKWENYELLERAPLTVDGIEGEMVAYLMDKLMPIPREDGQRLEYHLAVFFEYDGLIWEIEAECHQEIMDEVKADFDHIIETFTILD